MKDKNMVGNKVLYCGEGLGGLPAAAPKSAL